MLDTEIQRWKGNPSYTQEAPRPAGKMGPREKFPGLGVAAFQEGPHKLSADFQRHGSP